MCCYADAVFAPQCGGRGGVPAWCPPQLPGHLQPCWFCGGFTYAQHLYEPAGADCASSVPGHAQCCPRWVLWIALGTENLTCFIVLLQYSQSENISNDNQVCSCVCRWLSSLLPDPNMVNAYMYQPAGTNGQPAPPPGQAPPTTSPPYSNYQPTPTQGYQVWFI